MKTNWLRTVNDINQKRFVIPEGWETREQVAESLQCDPSKVGDLMKPGVEAGEIERALFPLWDTARRMAVSTPCYRLAGAKRQTKPNPARSDLEGRIEASILRNPSYSNAKIANSFRRCTASQVAAVRAGL